MHSQKIASHDKFLIVEKKQKSSEIEEEKQSKMTKLEIPAEKAPEFEFNYGTEGPIELSQLTV